jgi:hypothetical protein
MAYTIRLEAARARGPEPPPVSQSTRPAVDPIAEVRGFLDEVERAGEVERVVDRVQMIEVGRLGEWTKVSRCPA